MINLSGVDPILIAMRPEPFDPHNSVECGTTDGGALATWSGKPICARADRLSSYRGVMIASW
jgi:hypothetical protein